MPDSEPTPGERAAAILERSLRKELFVIESHCIVEPDRLTPHLADHLVYMIELERQGSLFASGPFTDEAGHRAGHGMTIVRAHSFDAARMIAEADPFFINRLRTFEVKHWTVVEGRITVSVDISSGAALLA